MPALRYAHVPVIINPASGPDRPVLSLLNAVFGRAGVDWEVYVTQRAGDARARARQWVEGGAPVVAVYGGDGTVKEVAQSLAGTPTHLAIFPGGTGNALACELNVPVDLTLAAELVCGAPAQVRRVDLGEVNGERFVLRASLGFETELLRGADRQLKDWLGKLAYPAVALQQMETLTPARYRLTLDGREVEAEGVQCTVANSLQMGLGGLTLAQGADVSDGRLDVLVLRTVDLAALGAIALSNVVGEDVSAEIQHWQAREVTVTADPPQAVAFGGTVVTQTPATFRVVPGALQVIVPDDAADGPRRDPGGLFPERLA
jgi:diacylglycerol kinase (ATP)